MKIRIIKSEIFNYGEIIDLKHIKGIVLDYGQTSHSNIHWLLDDKNKFEIIEEETQKETKPTLTQCIDRMKEIIG